MSMTVYTTRKNDEVQEAIADTLYGKNSVFLVEAVIPMEELLKEHPDATDNKIEYPVNDLETSVTLIMKLNDLYGTKAHTTVIPKKGMPRHMYRATVENTIKIRKAPKSSDGLISDELLESLNVLVKYK